jgi:hypothetical protein
VAYTPKGVGNPGPQTPGDDVGALGHAGAEVPGRRAMQRAVPAGLERAAQPAPDVAARASGG